MAHGRYLVGTSGWSYRSWHGDFYPSDLPAADELRFVAARTTATEVNATFYRLQQPASFRRWAQLVPVDHRFAVKGSRYITHMKQLRDPRAGLANFFASGVLALGERLDVVLWQLPSRTVLRPDVLADFLAALPRTAGEAAQLAKDHDGRLPEAAAVTESPTPDAPLRHAVEPRHASFDGPEAAQLLTDDDVATVASDSPGAWPLLDHHTASFRYVRLHGHSELYRSRYSDRLLGEWADRCRAWAGAGQDVHVHLDNDGRGHAPHDAVRLLRMLGAEREPDPHASTTAGTPTRADGRLRAADPDAAGRCRWAGPR
ncbi:DUF72 domain-containing protein [Nocardioides sp. Root190]|uniref:DUF72 domain-containing protein n=1 Tax=Nocardioides sp. Root190 TaxID=1736488 RepID=UPI0009E9CA1A|nr:DUF72 domain-containing protein [Nocardioides sp. Root190]